MVPRLGDTWGGEWQPEVPEDPCTTPLSSLFCFSLPPDKQSLRSEPSVVIVSCKDGRQLLSIPRAGKRHAGLYECSATNVLGSVTSSCSVAVAREPGTGAKGGSDGGCWAGLGGAKLEPRGPLGLPSSCQASQGSWPLLRYPRPTRTRRW